MSIKRIVGLIGLVAAGALIVHRCDDAPPTRAARPASPAAAGDQIGLESERPSGQRNGVVPRVIRESADQAPPRTFQLRLDPEEPDDLKQIREETWTSLTKFAADAALTDAQFQRLLGDLSDLAKLQETAIEGGVRRLSSEEQMAFWREQGTEFEDRAAAYLTDNQMVALRGQLTAFGLVAQVRRLGLLEETPTASGVGERR